MWISQNLNDQKSTLIQAITWCRQPIHHYQGQCWPSSVMTYGIIWLQGVNSQYLHWWWPCDAMYLAIHYNDIIMSVMVSPITSLKTVYSTVYSRTDQRKYQSSAPLAYVQGIHQWPMNSLHKGPVIGKMFPFDDIMWTAMVKTWFNRNILASASESLKNLLANLTCNLWCYFT